MKYILFLGFLAGCYTASLAQNKVQPTTDIRVAIANTEMNVLYMGYTNRVSVGASGLTDSMYVSCEGCTFISGSDEKGIYNVKVSRTATDVLIRIYDKTISDAPVATEVFRVQPLPRPRVYISGMSPFASSVEKNRLTDATLQV